MQISVIIPARNASSTIACTLSSLDHDKALIREILLVNDGSQDDTAAVARKAADLHGLPLAVIDVGFSNPGAARNAGLDRALGDRLFFLDADDEVIPGGIKLLTDALEASPTAGLAVGASIHRGQAAHKLKLPGTYGSDSALNAERYLLNEIRSITVGSALVTAEAAVGVRFPESINLDEDTIYWAAILSRCLVTTITQPVLAYNLDEARMSRRFVSNPQGVFGGISVELDKLRTLGITEEVLQKRKSFISMRIVRHLTRQRRFREASEMMRVSRIYGGGGLQDLKALQYNLRIWRGYAAGIFGFGKAGKAGNASPLSRANDEKLSDEFPGLVAGGSTNASRRHGNGSSE
ncbi:MAG: glycosyltransferase family 2 protein [Mesorhizobium sp.]|nr:glycosyltransferase family 2 protein [Mesorhizobium sp.]